MKFYVVTLIAGIFGSIFIRYLQIEFKIPLIFAAIIYFFIIMVFIVIFFKNLRPKIEFSYKCTFCGRTGKLATISNTPFQFLLSRWYKDNKGFNHEIIICNDCGCIHDVKFSFLKMLISMFLGNPYKQISAINLIEFGTAIAKKMKEYDANARSVAFYEYGINEAVIDYLVNSKIVGISFAEKLEEQKNYSSKRNNAIAKKINDTYFGVEKSILPDDLDMTMFGFKDLH